MLPLAAGCATAPLPSGLDNFNGGFDTFSRSEVLSFTPQPSIAPMNARNVPMWTYDPGYRSISGAPVNRYSAYYAMPWLWWVGGSAAVHGSGFGPSGSGTSAAASGFAGRSGSGDGGGRGGGE